MVRHLVRRPILADAEGLRNRLQRGMNGFRFDEDEFRLLARERLLREPPAKHRRGDYDLNADLPAAGVARAAAVLVPIVARRPELSILLTQRTDALASHSGQVAFPGGKIDPTD